MCRTIYLYICVHLYVLTYKDIADVSWFPDREPCNIPLQIYFSKAEFFTQWLGPVYPKYTFNNDMRYVENMREKNLWKPLMPKPNWRCKAGRGRAEGALCVHEQLRWSARLHEAALSSVARASVGLHHPPCSFLFGFCMNLNKSILYLEGCVHLLVWVWLLASERHRSIEIGPGNRGLQSLWATVLFAQG